LIFLNGKISFDVIGAIKKTSQTKNTYITIEDQKHEVVVNAR